jgi:hypothetical protein
MPTPTAYNTGSAVSGSIQQNNISYVVDGQNRNYRDGFGGLNWISEVPPSNNLVFVGNTTSIGRGPAGFPVFYPTLSTSSEDILNTLNKLPGSPGNFENTGSGYVWALNNNFFINNANQPFGGIVADGLVLYLDAGKVTSYPTTASTWYDLSGNNNGVLTNGPTWNSNGWITFDGVDDLSTVVGAGITDYSQPFSMGTWFYIDPSASWDNGFRSNIYSIAGSYSGQYGLFKNAGDTFGMQLRDADSTIYATVSGNSKGIWYYLISTWNGSILKLYRNGELVSTQTAGGITGVPDTPNLYIGGRRAFGGAIGNFYQGNIAKCEYYKRELSATEILQNYYQAPIVTSGLIFAADAGNLVSYESGSATMYSLTGSSSGSLVNGVGYSNRNGGGWVFDGVDDYINVSDPQLLNPGVGSFSLDFWCNISTNVPTSSASCLLEARGTGLYGFLAIGYRNSGRMQLFVNDNVTPSQNVYQSTTTPVQRGVWIHEAMVVDRDTQQITFYYNGFQTGNKVTITDTGSIDPGSGYVYWVGGDRGGAEMNGIIAISRQYNRALTASEISQNFNAQRSRFGI